MEKWLVFLIVFSALGSGLIAGVFFAFSSVVMRALRKLPPREGIRAMQSLNAAAVNPSFMSVFIGTAAACAALFVIAWMHWSERGAAYLMWGSVLYLSGAIGVTMAGNVPLNNALAGIDLNGANSEQMWREYQTRWMLWNHLRAFAAMFASAFFIHPLW